MVEDITAEDTFLADEVRLQSAGVLLSIEEHPDGEHQRHRHTARDAAHLTRPCIARAAVILSLATALVEHCRNIAWPAICYGSPVLCRATR